MKPPKTPFWAWTDIGDGYRWYLCRITNGSAGEPMIAYLNGDFEDFWYDGDWDEDDIVVIRPPKPKDE